MSVLVLRNLVTTRRLLIWTIVVPYVQNERKIVKIAIFWNIKAKVVKNHDFSLTIKIASHVRKRKTTIWIIIQRTQSFYRPRICVVIKHWWRFVTTADGTTGTFLNTARSGEAQVLLWVRIEARATISYRNRRSQGERRLQVK